LKNKTLKNYVPWVLFVEAVGFLSGILSRSGTQAYMESAVKPALTPPGILFPIVWTILYGLLGVSAARISMAETSASQSWAMNLFVIQLVLNFFWPLIFFNAQAYGLAVIWILLLLAAVVAMVLTFYRIDPVAAWLQIPYILWLLFATYLTISAWQLNR